jgi:Uma2 family endonuclease
MSVEDAMPPTARPGAGFTVDDFMLFPDDGQRHELIDGEHYVAPSPNTRHQRLVQALYLALAEHLRAHPEQGEAFVAPFDVVLSFRDVVEPDLLLIAGDQWEILTEQHVKGAPALVVEVLSPATKKRDEHIKHRLFERAGVREYWLLDPDLDRVRVFRRASDSTLPAVAELTATEGDVLVTPLLSGFSLRIDQFFRR